MGFPDTDGVYANVRRGRLSVKRGDKTYEYPYFQGKLVDVRIVKDSYEDNEYEKVLMTMEDNERIIVAFRLEGWYSQGFFSRFRKINKDHQFTLGVMPSEQNDKMSFCWVKQGGQVIKKDDNFPKPERHEFKGHKVTDWSKFVTAVKEMLQEENIKVSADDIPPQTDDDWGQFSADDEPA